MTTTKEMIAVACAETTARRRRKDRISRLPIWRRRGSSLPSDPPEFRKRGRLRRIGRMAEDYGRRGMEFHARGRWRRRWDDEATWTVVALERTEIRGRVSTPMRWRRRPTTNGIRTMDAIVAFFLTCLPPEPPLLFSLCYEYTLNNTIFLGRKNSLRL
jgi:hypothetical protein